MNPSIKHTVSIDMGHVYPAKNDGTTTPPSLTASTSVSPRAASIREQPGGSRNRLVGGADGGSFVSPAARRSTQKPAKRSFKKLLDDVDTIPESAQQVAALLENECRVGNFECLLEIVAAYHKRLETLERVEVEHIRLKLEADALRKACAEESKRAADMTSKCNELQFRFMSGLGGAGARGADDFMESTQNSQGDPDAQRRNMLREIGLNPDEDEDDDDGDIPSDGKDATATISQLKARSTKLKEKASLYRSKLEEQGEKVVRMQETYRRKVQENKRTIDMFNATKEELAQEQTQKKAQADKMSKEILELRHKVQSMDLRNRTEVANLTDKFEKKEAMLAKTNQNLSFEVERLKHVERKYHELEGELATSQNDLKQEQAHHLQSRDDLKEKYEALRENVRKIIKDIASCFDALPLKMKIGKQSATPASNSLANLPTLMTLGELDLVRDLNGLSSAIAFMAKILVEKMDPALVEKIKAERAQLEEIQAKRVQLNLQLAKVQVSKLGEHFQQKIADGVQAETEADGRLTELRNDVSLEAQALADGTLQPIADPNNLLPLGEGDDPSQRSSRISQGTPLRTPGAAGLDVPSPYRTPGSPSMTNAQSPAQGSYAGSPNMSPLADTLPSGGLPALVVNDTAALTPLGVGGGISPGIPTFQPIEKGVFAHPTAVMEELHHAREQEWDSMQQKSTAERLRNLAELEKDIEHAHHDYEVKHLGGKKLPAIDPSSLNPKSKFGLPELMPKGGRAGGKVPGKIISSLAHRKGLPTGSPGKKQPKLAVKNSLAKK